VTPITRDIARSECVTKEKAIAHAQYLDPVYSQSGALYELLPDAPWPSSDPMASKSQDVPLVDGVIGLVSQNLLNILPNKSWSQMLFLIVLPRIHLALVKPQRSMLSGLPQRTNP